MIFSLLPFHRIKAILEISSRPVDECALCCSQHYIGCLCLCDACTRSIHKTFGKPPHEIQDRTKVKQLFQKCIAVWQNMSINTIMNYGRMTVDPARGLHLSDNFECWVAPQYRSLSSLNSKRALMSTKCLSFMLRGFVENGCRRCLRARNSTPVATDNQAGCRLILSGTEFRLPSKARRGERYRSSAFEEDP